MSNSSTPSLDQALAFAEFGFGIFSVWGIKDGVCLCGKDCGTPGKHPIPVIGLKAATTDALRITNMLAAPGSAGSYGIVPQAHTIAMDCDGVGWQDKLRSLHLPKTVGIETANGVHLWFYWPDEYGPPPAKLFGFVVRSPEHPGYVIGPGSTHVTGFRYRLRRVNGEDFIGLVNFIGQDGDLPADKVPEPTLSSITVSEGMQPPETVPTGVRHPYLRDRARTFRGGGLTGEDLFRAVDAINQRLPEPKTEEEVRRAIGEVETKFAEDPLPVDVTAIPTTALIVPIAQYRAAQPANIEWVSPLAAYGYVSLLSGPPKSGKSTLVSNLLAAREKGIPFLWGDPVPKGPTLLVTEESGYAVVRKTEGLNSLDVMDRRAFVLAGLSKLDHLLDILYRWCGEQGERGFILIDTLAIWGGIKDENDATAANAAVSSLAVFTQVVQSATQLIHHARKGGGEHGEAIRGSNAIFGAVDHSAELSYALGQGDIRKLSLSGRLDFPEVRTLEFDRIGMTYSLSAAPPPDDFKLEEFPIDDGKTVGLTRLDTESLWDLKSSGANNRLRELVSKGLLVRRDVRGATDRVAHGEYWRTPPLLVLDNRSVSEEMAAIFHPDGD